MSETETTKTWTFSRVGGVDQVLIRNGEDIANLARLDQKLWAVLAMPSAQPAVKDSLEYLDADKDGKVRVSDILRAVEELKAQLKTLDTLFEKNDRLGTDQVIDEDLRKTMLQIAPAGAQSARETVDLAAVEEAIGAFSALPFNGDGVITSASTKKETEKALVAALVGAGYSAQDAGGEAGVNASCLDNFLADTEALRVWMEGGKAFADRFTSEEAGRAAMGLFKEVRAPLDDYFMRCRVVAMAGDSQATGDLAALMSSLLAHSLSEDDGALACLPLAMPVASGILSLSGALHPSYEKAVLAFFGCEAEGARASKTLSQAEWEALAAQMDAYAQWLEGKPQSGAAGLGAQVFEPAFGAEALGALRRLIDKDAAVSGKSAALGRLRILLLLKRDFVCILENFVNLSEFYSKKRGLFRSGRLFLDSRELELCLDVKNAAAHAVMANLSSMYLLYCDLSSRDGRKKSIVAALTAGDADSIFVGRNGVFYDSDGADWDAVITRIVAQPISIREAFFSPYKWFVRTLEDFAMKRAASAEAANMDKMKGAAQTSAQAGKPEAKPEQIAPKKIDVGTVAAIGVALGSIGAMVTGLVSLFFGLGIWIPLGIVGVLLLISGPSMILAFVKLRKRNIGPLLNAEGWAVNGRFKINVPFGASLSHLAELPKGAARGAKDPFAPKRRPWALYVVLLLAAGLAAAYFLGWLRPLFGA